AILSRIIYQPNHIDEYIIAVGYKNKLIEDYLKISHPDINITFVEINNFDGHGSGPGLSLFECRKFLQEPFIFTACDTIISSSIPNLNQNWLGVKEVDNIHQWCSVKIDPKNYVRKIFYKQAVDTNLAFIGIAYIQDHTEFWAAFDNNKSLMGNEMQVNNGLDGLISSGLFAQKMEWIDTGTETNYIRALKYYEKNYSFIEKQTDITYRVDDSIIKYFPDKSTSSLRYSRAKSYANIFPPVQKNIGNYYSYLYQKGDVLSKKLSYSKCLDFLKWAENKLWKKSNINSVEFEQVTYNFYYTKTLNRLNTFIETYLPEKKESEISINGLPCSCAKDLLNVIDRNFYRSSIPSKYHGDLHADNIICLENDYRLIDWRQNFGESVDYGDVYYDLSKFYHTLILSVDTMEQNNFQAIITEDEVLIDHYSTFNAFEATEAFWLFIKKFGYDSKRIRIIDALIFLNMAPLYSKNMAEYLYYLGRYLLQKILQKTL
ncbi:hypothetical protein MHK_000949, partial [Candidatus Magnetomorum sp. HK-1]